jgi:hypothetical protein
MTFDYNTMLNHHLSQKLKRIGICEFNNLIYILMLASVQSQVELVKWVTVSGSSRSD